jgi:hypothetical protein
LFHEKEMIYERVLDFFRQADQQNSRPKQERPLLIKEGIQVIDLPPSEKEKFLKVASEEGWKDVLQKNPKTGPELRNRLTHRK